MRAVTATLLFALLCVPAQAKVGDAWVTNPCTTAHVQPGAVFRAEPATGAISQLAQGGYLSEPTGIAASPDAARPARRARARAGREALYLRPDRERRDREDLQGRPGYRGRPHFGLLCVPVAHTRRAGVRFEWRSVRARRSGGRLAAGHHQG